MKRSAIAIVALLGLVCVITAGCGGKPEAQPADTTSGSAAPKDQADLLNGFGTSGVASPEVEGATDPRPSPIVQPEESTRIVAPETTFVPKTAAPLEPTPADEPTPAQVAPDPAPREASQIRSFSAPAASREKVIPFNPLRAPAGERAMESPRDEVVQPPLPSFPTPSVSAPSVEPPREVTASAAPSFAMSAAEPETAGELEEPSEAGSAPPPEPARDAVAEPKGAAATITPESDEYEIAKVFYGTDRRAVGTVPASSLSVWRLIPALATAALAVGLAGLAWRFPSRRLPFAVASALFVLAVVGCCWQAAASLLFTPSAVMRVYGNERGELETGVCEVTIPKSHQRGQLESASLLRLELKQDAARHIVLQSVIPKERTEFLAELSAAVARSPQRDVLIFIHGYNVDFEDAARRTAQLAKDLELQGAPVCYSWPSQAGLLQYAVDETNVVWTVPHLKQFLLEVVRESDARSVNVIAHSMGNRALTSALKELRYELQDDARLFNQVVLAAPDIDADIFRRDIAPAITSTARRVTLYASSKDRALAVSKRLHGYPRAGESGPSLLLVEDIDTIDASGIDFSLLGHSYYGGNSNILADLGLLIRQGLPAASRMNLAANRRDGLTYWVFKGVATAGLTGSEEHRR